MTRFIAFLTSGLALAFVVEKTYKFGLKKGKDEERDLIWDWMMEMNDVEFEKWKQNIETGRRKERGAN